MTKAEYLENVMKSNIALPRAEIINRVYRTEIDEVVAKIASYADKVDFFDEERRALSFQEIANPKMYINFDFVSIGLIPLIDAYDNTYIVYVISDKKWAKFNTIDCSLFKKRDRLEDVL